MFAALVASGTVEAQDNNTVGLGRLPDAVLKLRLPYIPDANWETILQIKEEEKDSLELFRTKVLEACAQVPTDLGSSRFLAEVERIQEDLIEKNLTDLDKSFRSLRTRHWFKALGLGVVALTLEVACFLGLPPLTSLVAGGAGLKMAMDVALDICKEEQEWRKKAKSNSPMYFIWRLCR